MRVLVLNGSAKGSRSNTMRITTAFLEGFPKETEIQQINLCELELKPCRGCFSCWNRTPGHCVISDDMQQIYEKIHWANVVIESFPLYFFGMPSLMKTMTDRCLPFMLPCLGAESEAAPKSIFNGLRDPAMLKKRLVLISSCGYTNAHAMYPSLLQQFDLICEGHVYSSILCPEGEIFVTGKGLRQQAGYLSDVQKAGTEFASTGTLSVETEAKLSEPMLSPIGFRTLTAAHWAQTTPQAKDSGNP